MKEKLFTNICIKSNLTNIDVECNLDYIKLLIINNLYSYYTNFFKESNIDTNTVYDKILFPNEKIYNIVKNNKLFNFFNNAIKTSNNKTTYRQILKLNLFSQCNNIILNKISKHNKLSYNKLLYLNSDIYKSSEVVDNDLINKYNNIDFLVLPDLYLKNINHNIRKSVDNAGIAEKTQIYGGFNLEDLKKYIKNFIVDGNSNSTKYDYIFAFNKSDLTFSTPLHKYIINSGYFLSLILISLLQLNNGGHMVITLLGKINPVVRKIIYLLSNVFEKVEIVESYEEVFLVCQNFRLNSDKYTELHKFFIHLFKKENILDTYYDYARILPIHFQAIMKDKPFFYNLPENVKAKYAKHSEAKYNSKLVENAEYISDLYLDCDLDGIDMSVIRELFKFNKIGEIIANKIDGIATNYLNTLNGFIIEHDIKFGEGNYDMDDEFVTKVFYDKYYNLMRYYKLYDIPYNKSYDVYLTNERSRILDKYFSFNSNINTRFIKYHGGELNVKPKTQSYTLSTGSHYQYMDNLFRIRNNLVETLADMNPSKYMIENAGTLDLPPEVERAISQFTRGVSKYISRNYPIPPEISNNKAVSNAFCKLWEIYHVFEIFDGYKKGDKLRVLHFCEAPGQWIISTRYFLSKRYPEFMIMSDDKDDKGYKDDKNKDKKVISGGGKTFKRQKPKFRQSKKQRNSKKQQKSQKKSPMKYSIKSPINSLLKSIFKPLQKTKKNFLGRKREDLWRQKDGRGGTYQEQPDKIADYEWRGNSLNPFNERNIRMFGPGLIKDTYRIIEKNIDRWLWAEDNTGDILNPVNVRWYREYCKSWGFPTLVTGDAGINTKSESLSLLQQLEYGQMVMVAATCGIGGSCVIKHFSPYLRRSPEESEKAFGMFYNMIFTYYHMFNEIALFKPYCSNPDSGELYLIGKGFKGVSDKNLELLLEILGNWEVHKCWIDRNDMPDSFIKQVNTFLDSLSQLNIDALDTTNLLLSCLKDDNKKFHNLAQCDAFLDEEKVYKLQEPQFKKWIKEHKYL